MPHRHHITTGCLSRDLTSKSLLTRGLHEWFPMPLLHELLKRICKHTGLMYTCVTRNQWHGIKASSWWLLCGHRKLRWPADNASRYRRAAQRYTERSTKQFLRDRRADYCVLTNQARHTGLISLPATSKPTCRSSMLTVLLTLSQEAVCGFACIRSSRLLIYNVSLYLLARKVNYTHQQNIVHPSHFRTTPP